MLGELRDLFFGDLDDKYAPTVQSLRLAPSGGLVLVGTFCLLHSVTVGLSWAVNRAFELVLGPAEARFWVAWRMPIDLLAVAYLRCLELLAERTGKQPAARAVQSGRLGRFGRVNRGRRRLPGLALATACLLAAGWASQAASAERSSAEVRGQIRDEVPVSRAGQTLAVRDVTGGTKLSLGAAGSRVSTTGNFIAVGVRLRTPGERLVRGLDCSLHQDGQVARPARGVSFAMPEPGFQQSNEVIFERPRSGIAGAELRCLPTEAITTCEPELVVALDGGSDGFGYEDVSPPIAIKNHAPQVIA